MEGRSDAYCKNLRLSWFYPLLRSLRFCGWWWWTIMDRFIFMYKMVIWCEQESQVSRTLNQRSCSFFFLLSFFFFPPSLRYICGPVGCLGKEMLFVITTTFPPLGARNAGSSDESLCCDGTRSRADLLLWMPTTLSSVLLFPGDCFWQDTSLSVQVVLLSLVLLLFSSDCTHMVLLRASRSTAVFLLQVCRFSQKSAQAESTNCLWGKGLWYVTTITSWKTGLSSGEVRCCIDLKSVFSMVWTKMNCIHLQSRSFQNFFLNERVESYFETNSEMLHLM